MPGRAQATPSTARTPRPLAVVAVRAEERAQVHLVDRAKDRPHHVIVRHPIRQIRRQQHRLPPLSTNKSRVRRRSKQATPHMPTPSGLDSTASSPTSRSGSPPSPPTRSTSYPAARATTNTTRAGAFCSTTYGSTSNRRASASRTGTHRPFTAEQRSRKIAPPVSGANARADTKRVSSVRRRRTSYSPVARAGTDRVLARPRSCRWDAASLRQATRGLGRGGLLWGRRVAVG